MPAGNAVLIAGEQYGGSFGFSFDSLKSTGSEIHRKARPSARRK